MPKLVYIGGFGRSGSTLLEYLLTCEANLVACGEVARHARKLPKRKSKIRNRKKCTCGRPVTECSIWEPFQLERNQSERLDHKALTLATFKHVSKSFGIMVDSSKTAWGSTFMPFRLHRGLGQDFLLVHLVRDPRAVCWSTIRALAKVRKNKRPLWPPARCLQTTVGWIAANLACEVFGLFHPQRYLRVRYEDLTGAPSQVVDKIFSRLPSPSHTALEQAGTQNNRHQLYGNAMRFKPLSPSSLTGDVAWKRDMPKAYRRLAALSWPLATKYGYFKP